MGGSKKKKKKKDEAPAPANEMAQLLASLDGIDDYGVPPLTVYDRFNTAGGESHGSYAVAQGASGWGIDIGGGFNFADLFAPKSGIKVQANLDLAGVRLPSSSVFLYRMPEHLTAHPHVAHPLSLAQLDGVSWTGNVSLSGTVGFDFDVLGVIAAATLKGKLSGSVLATTTKLRAAETKFFATSDKKGLAAAVDRLLVYELRKACRVIVDAQAGWAWKNLGAVAASAGGSAVSIAKAAYGEDVKERAKGVVSSRDFERLNEPGWKLALVGGEVALAGAGVVGGLGYGAYKAGQAALDNLYYTDEALAEALANLKIALDNRLQQLDNAQLPMPKKDNDELATLPETISRLDGFIAALGNSAYDRDLIFYGPEPQNPGPQPPEPQQRKDGTALRLSSYDWEVRGDFDSGASAIAVGAVSHHGDVSVVGRNTTFHLRMRAANDVTYVQHTKTSFVQTTVSAAQTLQFLHSGADEVDKRVLKGFRDEDERDRKTPGAPWKRRFGALVYRSANVYCTILHANKGPYPIHDRVSGVTLGTSVRSGALCDYADEVRDGRAMNDETKALETWLSEQIACTPEHLREFVASAPLGREYRPRLATEPHGHVTGYPDALLVEASYTSPAGAASIPAGVDKADLFDFFGYKDPETFRAEVGKKRVLVALRLRYRVQSALSKTSKKSPHLGVSNVMINFQIGKHTEVGHESVVDLHTVYPLRFGSDDHVDDADRTIPPVVLFNRG